MTQRANEFSGSISSTIVEKLVSFNDEQLDLWLAENSWQLSLQLIQTLKDAYITAENILAHPQQSEQITRTILRLTTHCTDIEAAYAVAYWARGLWEMYHAPAESVASFRAALKYYRTTKDELSIARLLSNLVGVLAECGANQEAEDCYYEADMILTMIPDAEPRFLIRLKQNFGWLLHNWGRYEEALNTHQLALKLAIEANLEVIASEIRVNRNLTVGQLGRLGEIERNLLNERFVAEQHHQVLTVARIDLNLGEFYTIQGRPADALRRFQESAHGFEISNNPGDQCFVLVLQATLLRQLGSLRIAQVYYQQALSILQQQGLRTIQGETIINLAICLRQFGGNKHLRRAITLLNQAHEYWSHIENPYWIVRVYFEKILVAQAQKNYEQAMQLIWAPPAIPGNQSLHAEYQYLMADILRESADSDKNRQTIIHLYEAAITFAKAEGLLWLHRKALIGLGKFYLNLNWSRAQQLLEDAAEIDEQIRLSLSLEEIKASFHEQANDLFDDLIRSAYQHCDNSLVLLYSWRAKASAFLDLATNIAMQNEYTPEQKLAIESLRTQIAMLRWNLAQMEETSRIDDHYEESCPELTELEQKLLKVRQHRRQKQTFSSKLTVDQLQNALVTMEADILLEYVRCGDEIYGICANRKGVQSVIKLCSVDVIAEITGQLALSFYSFNALHEIERENLATARVKESRQLLHVCYDFLVMPFQATISSMENVSRILVAPCDILSMLPFSAFWTGERYWIEQVEIELIQSGALFLLDTINVPTYSQSIIVAASSGQVTGVRKEAAQLATILEESALFIDAPVLNYLKNVQFPPRILHISAHTLQRGDLPIFSGIQLGGEVLSVEESYELPLWGTELVTLSGCTTANGMDSDASLFAFQSALLIAGAKRILCTLWPIADGVTGDVMCEFYKHLNRGSSPPTALRQFQLQFIYTSSAIKHPALWAAFTCIRR